MQHAVHVTRGRGDRDGIEEVDLGVPRDAQVVSGRPGQRHKLPPEDTGGPGDQKAHACFLSRGRKPVDVTSLGVQATAM